MEKNKLVFEATVYQKEDDTLLVVLNDYQKDTKKEYILTRLDIFNLEIKH